MPNLCMSINTVIVANVFYDVCYESKFQYLDIHKAVLSDYNVTCRFWDYYVPIEKRTGKSNNEIWEYAINKYQKDNILKQPLKNNKSLKSIFMCFFICKNINTININGIKITISKTMIKNIFIIQM